MSKGNGSCSCGAVKITKEMIIDQIIGPAAVNYKESGISVFDKIWGVQSNQMDTLEHNKLEIEELTKKLKAALNCLPNSREKSLAITKLEEMWLWLTMVK